MQIKKQICFVLLCTSMATASMQHRTNTEEIATSKGPIYINSREKAELKLIANGTSGHTLERFTQYAKDPNLKAALQEYVERLKTNSVKTPESGMRTPSVNAKLPMKDFKASDFYGKLDDQEKRAIDGLGDVDVNPKLIKRHIHQAKWPEALALLK